MCFMLGLLEEQGNCGEEVGFNTIFNSSRSMSRKVKTNKVREFGMFTCPGRSKCRWKRYICTVYLYEYFISDIPKSVLHNGYRCNFLVFLASRSLAAALAALETFKAGTGGASIESSVHETFISGQTTHSPQQISPAPPPLKWAGSAVMVCVAVLDMLAIELAD